MTVVAVGALLLASTDWRRVALGLGVAAAGLLGLTYLREQTMLAAAWALALAVVLMPHALWLPRVATCLAVVAIVPYMAGLGSRAGTL